MGDLNLICKQTNEDQQIPFVGAKTKCGRDRKRGYIPNSLQTQSSNRIIAIWGLQISDGMGAVRRLLETASANVNCKLGVVARTRAQASGRKRPWFGSAARGLAAAAWAPARFIYMLASFIFKLSERTSRLERERERESQLTESMRVN